MKPATYNLANLGLVVTISPDARRWVQEHIVSLETYAWQQAQRHIDGKSVDRGVVIEDRRFKRPSDIGGDVIAEHFKFRATTPKTSAAIPSADVSAATPPAASAEAGEWFRADAGSHVRLWSSKLQREFLPRPYGTSYPCEDGLYEDRELTPITPTEAAQWLRDNGHEAEAARIDGDVHPKLRDARVFRDAYPCGDTSSLYAWMLHAPGIIWAVDYPGGGWRRTGYSDWALQFISDAELHGPERQEILRDFAASEVGKKWLREAEIASS